MAPRNDEGRPPPAPRLFSRLSHISKKSFLSHSSSFEADDERSTTPSGSLDEVLDRMTSRSSSFHFSPPRYPGEDTRPTSSKELAGWYMYAFAAETYVICGKSSTIHVRASREALQSS